MRSPMWPACLLALSCGPAPPAPAASEARAQEAATAGADDAPASAPIEARWIADGDPFQSTYVSIDAAGVEILDGVPSHGSGAPLCESDGSTLPLEIECDGGTARLAAAEGGALRLTFVDAEGHETVSTLRRIHLVEELAWGDFSDRDHEDAGSAGTIAAERARIALLLDALSRAGIDPSALSAEQALELLAERDAAEDAARECAARGCPGAPATDAQRVAFLARRIRGEPASGACGGCDRAFTCGTAVRGPPPPSVHEGPAASAPGAGTLAAGTTVEVAEVRGAWTRIAAPVAGWVRSESLAERCE